MGLLVLSVLVIREPPLAVARMVPGDKLRNRHGAEWFLRGTAANGQHNFLLESIPTHRELHFIADAIVEHRIEDIRGRRTSLLVMLTRISPLQNPAAAAGVFE